MLGIKGTLSVVELKILKLRMQQGMEEKARRGELRRKLTPGYFYDLEVAGEAATGEEALERLDGVACDIILLDTSLQTRGGLRFIEDVRRRGRRIPILVVTPLCDEISVRQAVRAGANGIVPKDATPQELLDSIRHVFAGGLHLHPMVVQDFIHGTASAYRDLKPREVEVLRLAADGLLAVTARLPATICEIRLPGTCRTLASSAALMPSSVSSSARISPGWIGRRFMKLTPISGSR
ncbi:MAG: response regulator transcription factor [Armatimonadetes bacterium]|nr:response regulator transcription factor [Armatimonadota bacterium]